MDIYGVVVFLLAIKTKDRGDMKIALRRASAAKRRAPCSPSLPEAGRASKVSRAARGGLTPSYGLLWLPWLRRHLLPPGSFHRLSVTPEVDDRNERRPRQLAPSPMSHSKEGVKKSQGRKEGTRAGQNTYPFLRALAGALMRPLAPAMLACPPALPPIHLRKFKYSRRSRSHSLSFSGRGDHRCLGNAKSAGDVYIVHVLPGGGRGEEGDDGDGSGGGRERQKNATFRTSREASEERDRLSGRKPKNVILRRRRRRLRLRRRPRPELTANVRGGPLSPFPSPLSYF